MQYVIANKGKVLQHGVKREGHRTKDDSILINEKELVSFIPGETVADKLAVVNGRMYSADETKAILREEDWK